MGKMLNKKAFSLKALSIEKSIINASKKVELEQNNIFHLVLTVMKVEALLGNIEVLSWASYEPTSAWCLYPAMNCS